jgi:hypothetical protein
MPVFTSSPEQRARSRAAANTRWAKATPADRVRQGALMREGLLNAYKAKARNIAIANDWVPSEADIERSAIALRRADIQMAQVAAFEAMRTKAGLPAPTHAPTAAGINERAREAASNPPPATDADLAELRVWLAERQALTNAEFEKRLAKWEAGR